MPNSHPNSDARKVTVFTNKFMITGYIHLQLRNSYKGRLSDHLNNANTANFLPITEANIIDLYSGKIVKQVQCTIINKNNIESISEEDEIAES
jgi:hypothetical protein